MRGIRDLLPAGAADGPASGSVFKVERGAAGEKVAYRADALRRDPDPGPSCDSGGDRVIQG